MRIYFQSLLISVVLLAFNGIAHSDESSDNIKNEPVRHIVAFKYKQGSTISEIKQVTDAFRALKDEIPGILHFEFGVNNSPENLDQGYTHIYQITFKNSKARDTYLPHPQHTKFGDLLSELDILDSVFVVDYIVQP